MVLNDWQRGKLPFFVPPPGCMLEPKPEDGDEDEEEEEEEEEEDAEQEMEEDENEDEEYESDNDTTYTNDTAATDDTSKTTDSLYENIKFADIDKKNGEGEEIFPKPPKIPTNLQDLVKQDLRKIVHSVEYFDEEKYEGGRRKKLKKKKTTESAESVPLTAEEQKPKSDNPETISSEKSVAATSPAKSSGTKKVGEKRKRLSDVERISPGKKALAKIDNSGKKKRKAEETERTTPGKKIKTKSGVFKVSNKS